jgi:dTDP-4-amino-4,6-dideoxygalactose transaminase
VLGYNGPQEEAYCAEFAAMQGGGFADGVNSGTNAVWVALRALEIEPGGEVIVPPVTDPGGVMPVVLNHCIPVPADGAPASYNAGADQIAARITEHTRAILVAHIAGIPADMDAIVAVARARGLPVIEDCAQAHGATYQGRPVGTFGEAAVFSTMFGKQHSTGGQGGVVFTRDEALYWRVRRAADRGKPFGLDAGSNVVAGLNCNMDELHAAIGRVQLRKLPAMIRRRRELARTIQDGCAQRLRAVRMLGDPPGCEGSYWFVFFRVDLAAVGLDIDAFARALSAEGIPASPSYAAVPVWQDWYRGRAVFGTSGLPWTSPLYHGERDRDYPLPNIEVTTACHFHVTFHEGCSQREVDDFLAAAAKLEAACGA